MCDCVRSNLTDGTHRNVAFTQERAASKWASGKTAVREHTRKRWRISGIKRSEKRLTHTQGNGANRRAVASKSSQFTCECEYVLTLSEWRLCNLFEIHQIQGKERNSPLYFWSSQQGRQYTQHLSFGASRLSAVTTEKDNRWHFFLNFPINLNSLAGLTGERVIRDFYCRRCICVFLREWKANSDRIGSAQTTTTAPKTTIVRVDQIIYVPTF